MGRSNSSQSFRGLPLLALLRSILLLLCMFALLLRRCSALATASRSRSTLASVVEIEQFSCLSDNYGYLVHDPVTGVTAAIDTPEVTPILEALNRRGWKLTHILNTHHHADHAGGNEELSLERNYEWH